MEIINLGYRAEVAGYKYIDKETGKYIVSNNELPLFEAERRIENEINGINPFGVIPSNSKTKVAYMQGKNEDNSIKKQNELIKYFRYDHLPEKLQEVSKQFHKVALSMDDIIPDGSEKDAGMRKLLEAKDCFVRGTI